MNKERMLQFIVIILVLYFSEIICFRVKKYPLLMPNVHPNKSEQYICTSAKVISNKSFYIVGFEPNATMQTAHHMVLYGCKTPGTDKPYWYCGEMTETLPGSNSLNSSPCHEGSQVIYAWARDAKHLKLPNGVGFQVGLGSRIQYLVLQVHYSNISKFKDGSTDDSGIFLFYTEKPQTKLAGVILSGTLGTIPAKSVTHMETLCEIGENKTIYPFAYRVHTHSLGKVVAGYKVHKDENNVDHWTLLGKRNPLTPQMFYPVFNRDPITFGDRLAARCTMESNRSRITNVGATSADEMCNFYLMYYVKDGMPLDMKYCFSAGPPNFFWNDPANILNNIPDKEASNL